MLEVDGKSQRETERVEHLERKRQRGETEGKSQKGRDREERHKRRDIREIEEMRQKGRQRGEM